MKKLGLYALIFIMSFSNLSTQAFSQETSIQANIDENSVILQNAINSAKDILIDENAKAVDLVAKISNLSKAIKRLISNTDTNSDWELVWGDEFDDTNLDLTKWAYQLGTGVENGLDGWGNNEQQFYRQENVSIRDGILTIEAKKESVGGKDYTSGRLWTKPTYSKLYGKIEASIKSPAGDGMWPAFWMLPQDDVYGGWATSGEIDIMEARGREPNKVDGTIHYGGPWGNGATYKGDHYTLPNGGTFDDGFHTYSIEWEPGEIRWYVDGINYYTVTDWHTKGGNEVADYTFPAPFDQNFYILLNLAVGGNYDGGVMPGDNFTSAKMEVDYVRVYELTGRDYKTPANKNHILPSNPSHESLLDGNLIYNGTFDQGNERFAFWNVAKNNGANATTKVNEARQFEASNISSSNATDVILVQKGVQLIQGETYELTFDAKANQNKAIKVNIANKNNTTLISSSDVNLTTSIISHKVTFTANTSDAEAQLQFCIGAGNDTIIIDNVRMVKTTNNTTDYSKLTTYPVYNGDFFAGPTGWVTVSDGNGAATSVIKDGKAVVTVKALGDSPWNALLMQEGLTFHKGFRYRLSFDASSSVNRDIQAILETEDGSWSRRLEETLNVTGTKTSYSYEFTAPANETLGLKFFLGNTSNSALADITIENVEIYLMGSPFKKPPTFQSNTVNNIIGNDITLKYASDNTFTNAITSVTVNGNPVSPVPIPSGNTITIPASNFPKGGTYKIKIAATTYEAASVTQTIVGVDGNLVRNGDFSEGSYAWDIVKLDGGGGDFTFSKDRGATVSIRHNGGWPQINSIQLKQVGIPLKAGKEYQLVIAGSASSERTIRVEHGRTYTDYNLTTNMSNKIIDIPASATDTDITVNFLLALVPEGGTEPTMAHMVNIRKVSVIEKGTSIEEPDQLPDLGPELITNGDFSKGDTIDWIKHTGNGGNANFSIGAANGAVININNAGTDISAIMLNQNNIPVKAGSTYQATITAYSSVARTIRLVPAGLVGVEPIILKLTPNETTYSATITIPTGGTKMNINFFMGAGTGQLPPVIENIPTGAHTVYIKNVSLKQLVSETEPPIEEPSDKNLVKNGDFANGNTDWKEYVHDDGAAANFNYTVGTGANISVINKGKEFWSVLLEQGGIQLKAGKTYELSVTAKADKDHTIKVQYLGGETDYTLNSTMSTKIIEIKSGADNDMMLKLLFGDIPNGITSTVPYTINIQKVSIVEVEGSSEPEPDVDLGPELLKNWDFTSGGANWITDTPTGLGGMATFDFNNGANIAIANAGTLDAAIQLNQVGVMAKAGSKYRVTITASSTVPRTIRVVPGGLGAGVQPSVISLTTIERSFVVDIPITANSVMTIGLAMGKGSGMDTPENIPTGDHTIHIKSMSVKEIGGTEAPKPGSELLKNGDFSDGYNNWITHKENGADVTFEYNTTNGANVKVNNAGNGPAAIQLYQIGVPVEAGKKYQATITGYSTIERTIRVVLGGAESAIYIPTGEVTHTVDITAANNAMLMLNIFMGNAGTGLLPNESAAPTEYHEIHIKSISFKEIVDTTGQDAAPTGTELIKN